MLKAVKVRLYPTDAQQAHLAKSFGCCRWVWNRSLVLMSETYQKTGKGLSAYDMKRMLPIWKKQEETAWLGECYSQCLQSSVLNLSRAFINFFDGRAQYPTFKSKHRRQSIQFPANVQIENETLIKFPGQLGRVRAKIHRAIAGKLKTVTVSRMLDGRYYASLLFDDGNAKPDQNKAGKVIGIDLGLTDFAATSDGSKYQNPRHLQKHGQNLKHKQRNLSRKQDKTTGRYQKAQKLLANVHSKISRVRVDFLHKLSRKIVNENQIICVENLAVKNMVKDHTLAKAISDVGWGQFCTMLKYKAEAEGKIYIEVDRFFPSPQLCSETLLPISKMGLDVRSFDCPRCGKRHDRDVNAAINIKNEGLRILVSGSGTTAQGGSVRPKRHGRKSTAAAATPA